MDQSKFSVDKLSLVHIVVLTGNIHGNPDLTEDISGYHVLADVKMGTSQIEQLVAVRLTIRITAQNHVQVDLNLFGEYVLDFHYKVLNFEELVFMKEEGIVFDNLLLCTVQSLSYSTARGILMMRTQGTSLGQVILPIVDPATFNADSSQ